MDNVEKINKEEVGGS